MSATPNNAGAGWTEASAHIAVSDPGIDAGIDIDQGSNGRDALQALLAFACIHKQASKRREGQRSGAIATVPKQDFFGLDEVLQLVAARAISITGADGVAIGLAEENGIVCRASAGTIAPDPGVRLDPNSGFSGACLRSGQTVRCDDSETDSRVNAEACRLLGTRSMIAVPLSAKQRIAGLIEAFSNEPFGFNDSDVRSLNLLGELILAAVRPEEEDRLAALAKSVVPAPLAAPDKLESAEALRTASMPAPSNIILDEKFAPSSVDNGVAPGKPTNIAATLPELTLDPKPVRIEAPGSQPKPERALSSILLTVALVVIAVGLGWVWLWKFRHVEQSISANTQSHALAVRGEPEPNETLLAVQLDVKPGTMPQVTGIRHWSSADASTVVVDLEDQVQYEAHSLDNPPRIYFDLHDTKMAPGLLNQSIVVNDEFLKRVRMAQPLEGVTRIVLETKGESDFAVKLDPSPYRLTIEVHKASVTAAPATLSKPSPAVTVTPKKKTSSNIAQVSPAEFRVVLDAGHGGWDLGTVGRKGLLEKDLVLDIVQRLGELVENKLGAQVIYTREDDSYLPLEKRAEVANLAKADLFLSVHANYSDLATARGVETYYTNTYSSIKARTADDTSSLKEVNWTGVDIREKVTDSHRLAADVQQALYGGLAARNPDIRNRGVKEAQYVVLTGTQMPAVLAEVSFVSSPADEDKLQSSAYRQQIAEALYKGVAKYREDSRHNKLASARN